MIELNVVADSYGELLNKVRDELHLPIDIGVVINVSPSAQATVTPPPPSSSDEQPALKRPRAYKKDATVDDEVAEAPPVEAVASAPAAATKPVTLDVLRDKFNAIVTRPGGSASDLAPLLNKYSYRRFSEIEPEHIAALAEDADAFLKQGVSP